MGYKMSYVDEHPVPRTRDEIAEHYPDDIPEEPPEDTRRHDYMDMIAEHGEYDVFRVKWPLGNGNRVYVFNREFEEGISVPTDEANWHRLVNVFAEIVEEERDCRDAEYSSGGTLPSGCHKQKCKKCGRSWVIG